MLLLCRPSGWVTNTLYNWTGHHSLFKMGLLNRCALLSWINVPQNTGQDILINISKDTVAHRRVEGAFLYALIEFCPSFPWYEFELLHVWQDCSQCWETEQTPTCINTRTQKPHHSKYSPHNRGTGNNDGLMSTRPTLSQFSQWRITLKASYLRLALFL